MGDGRRSTLLGGLLVAACPLLCIGLPLLAAAGIGVGFALTVGGVVLGSVALAALGVGAFLAMRLRQSTAGCCALSELADPPEAGDSSAAAGRSLVELAKR